MATPNGGHHSRKMIVITVAAVLVIIAAIASYTYLEAMGRITPQWALWILPLATGLLTYLKSAETSSKQDDTTDLVQAVADRVVSQLQHQQAVANQALGALPPNKAAQILRDTPDEPSIPSDGDYDHPAR